MLNQEDNEKLVKFLENEKNLTTEISLDFLSLITKHNLCYLFSDTESIKPFFIISDIDLKKGLHKNNFTKHKERYNKIPGKYYLLKNDKLNNFKYRYNLKYEDKRFNSANAIYICDYVFAYNYLVKNTINEIQTIDNNINYTQKNTNTNEFEIQDLVGKLINYSEYNFRFEAAIKNNFLSLDKAYHRRYDWIEEEDNNFNIYELKSKTISEKNIKDKIQKKYFELAVDNYKQKNKKINFIFTSPKGITWEAKEYIKQINKKLKRISTNTEIKFIDLQDILCKIIENILEVNPKESHYYFYKLISENKIVSPRIKAKIKAMLNSNNSNL